MRYENNPGQEPVISRVLKWVAQLEVPSYRRDRHARCGADCSVSQRLGTVGYGLRITSDIPTGHRRWSEGLRHYLPFRSPQGMYGEAVLSV